MGNVLVVDDDKDTCVLLAKWLQQAGHKSTCVTSGGGALAHLKNEQPDVMILDVMMPGMDGEELLKRVRNDRRISDVPIICYSAIDDPAFIQRVLKEGANDYWVKGSLEFTDIQARLAKYMDAERAA